MAGSVRTDPTDLPDKERWTLYTPWLEHDDSGVHANAVICRIHQSDYLLDRQIEALEKQSVKGDGYSERLAPARLAERNRRRKSEPPDPSDEKGDPP